MQDTYLTTKEAAEYLRIQPQTLRKWRLRDKGPDFYKPSPGIVRYTRKDLDRWVIEQTRVVTNAD